MWVRRKQKCRANQQNVIELNAVDVKYLGFEWPFRLKSLLCSDDVGDDGDRGELSK